MLDPDVGKCAHMYGSINMDIQAYDVYMKTTVEIADSLLRQAKEIAVRGDTTLRELVESGLRKELASRQTTEYQLVDASFGGSGLQSGINEGDWRTIMDLVYEGRGG